MSAATRPAAPGDHVAVVGGGVVGGMCAWYLSQAGFEVTVVDRARFGAACSHGNCGYLCASHVLPLSQPGAVASTLRAMTKRNSPFAIRPRPSAEWLRWFLGFARACNRRDMLATARANHALLQSSLGLYQQLVDEEGIDCELEARGLLFVWDDERELEAYGETAALLEAEFGLRSVRHDRASLLALEPALKPVVAGAWHYPGDMHLRPDKLLAGLRARLEARGVRFVEETEVTGLDELRAGSGRAAVARTAAAPVRADHFVVAAGALTPRLSGDLGVRVPIEPGKGYSITGPRPAGIPRHPMIFEDSHVAVTPMASGFRIGSTMEFVGYDTTIHPRRLGLLTAAAEKYLHDPGGEVEETWYGWRPMSMDGRPIVGRAPALSNVWLATGHSMLGLSMATATGRLVAELVGGEDPHVDPTPYDPARFL